MTMTIQQYVQHCQRYRARMYFPDEAWRQLREVAKSTGMPMSVLVEQLITTAEHACSVAAPRLLRDTKVKLSWGGGNAWPA
jgi:hypothetical protein